MSEERLAIEVRRASGGQAQRDGDVIDLEHMDDGRRHIVLRAHGHRWDGVLEDIVAAHGERASTRTPLRATSPRPTSRITPCER